MDTATQTKIESLLADNPTLLVMKGTPEAPMCGFSARAVQILNHMGASFTSLDIFEHPDLREGLKEYSNWPTYPQLYVNGQLIGGVDIMTEMYGEGELHEVLGISLPTEA